MGNYSKLKEIYDFSSYFYIIHTTKTEREITVNLLYFHCRFKHSISCLFAFAFYCDFSLTLKIVSVRGGQLCKTNKQKVGGSN